MRDSPKNLGQPRRLKSFLHHDGFAMSIYIPLFFESRPLLGYLMSSSGLFLLIGHDIRDLRIGGLVHATHAS
jgi:hypothetical protein